MLVTGLARVEEWIFDYIREGIESDMINERRDELICNRIKD